MGQQRMPRAKEIFRLPFWTCAPYVRQLCPIPFQNVLYTYHLLVKLIFPFNLLKPNDIYIYMSYRSANLQTLHFKYLFNKYTY